MRRLSLSSKLFAAALPLVLAVAALLGVTIRTDLQQVADAERGAQLGETWDPLVAALIAVENELAGTPMLGSADGMVPEEVDALRRSADQAINSLSERVGSLGSAEAARKHVTQSRSALSAARRVLDIATNDPAVADQVDPLASYETALRELVSIGQLLPGEAGEPELGRQLLATVKLAEARVAADAVSANVFAWQQDPTDLASLAAAQVRLGAIESAMSEFVAVAPDDWSVEFRRSGYVTDLARFHSELDSVERAAAAGQVTAFDLAGFRALSDSTLGLQREITTQIVADATDAAQSVRRQALIRSGVALIAVVSATMITWLLTRSVTTRVRAMSRRANQVASEQLPALVEAIRDPRGKAALPALAPVSTHGNDELTELAQAFNTMQSALVDVGHQQVDVLRRGVSEIFVTMARRNRSLIDRQLAMLDEFEAEVDDPQVLSTYYQLDHMATRMRRNSESLLVLANAEPKRRRVKATEIDDVVRAAIGEVEDYRRIEIEALESLQVRGNVVADISHLLAEMLDNATSFSPPDSIVRVGGRRAGDAYVVRIVDNGVGIGTDRMRELNEMLREPPVVGLSVEPTLGVSVVSLLAHRHGITVHLSQGNPGTTVDVLLPSSLFGPIDVPAATTPSVDTSPAQVAAVAAPAVDADAAASTRRLELADLRRIDAVEAAHADDAAAAAPAVPPSLEMPVAAVSSPPAERPAPTPVEAMPVASAQPSLALRVPELAPETAPVATAPVSAPVAAPVAAASEFDRMVAPPVLPDGLSRGPVVPAEAVPPARADAVLAPVAPLLPTRTPGSGPDGGPDRLSSIGGGAGFGAPPSVVADAPVATSNPSALQAALSAFSSRRPGSDALPTRARAGELTFADFAEEPASSGQSTLDPSALRERLRAFQHEFRTAADGAEQRSSLAASLDAVTASTAPVSAAIAATVKSPNFDLGGDR